MLAGSGALILGSALGGLPAILPTAGIFVALLASLHMLFMCAAARVLLGHVILQFQVTCHERREARSPDIRSAQSKVPDQPTCIEILIYFSRFMIDRGCRWSAFVLHTIPSTPGGV